MGPSQNTGWQNLVSQRTGIIKSIERINKPFTEFELPVIWQAELSHFMIRGELNNDRYSAGKGITDEQAIRGAVGEALERYCGAIVNREKIITSSFEQLTSKAIHPNSFVHFSEKQYSDSSFPFRPIDSSMPISWLPALCLDDRNEILVPASLAYLSFYSDNPNDYNFSVTSNGMATGPTLEYAACNGLCELIERDAFMIYWLNKLPASRIDFYHQTGIEAHIARNYSRFGIELIAFDITTDIKIPVIMAMTVDRSGQGPAVVTGLGCHIDGPTALRKAIFEVCQIRPGDINKVASGAGRNLKTYSDIQDMDDHSAFFYPIERLTELDFLLNDNKCIGAEELPTMFPTEADNMLEHVVRQLKSVGYTSYLVDLTTDDISDVGFRVVRMLATELVPIYFGHGQEPLGNKRLYEVAKRLGYSNQHFFESDINPCPHPIA